MSSTIKSPWLVHYDASSCNGCDIEVLACLTPMYDVERFGIINTGNPKHADIFLVTGSVNERNINVVQQIYDQMLEPKVVIACGICACSGGIFKECYNTLGGIDVAIPVDVYAPGCAVRPEAIIDAVVTGLGILEQKRQALAANQDLRQPLPQCLTAADKYVDGRTVRDSALADTLGTSQQEDGNA
jgi:ech hydrogenase subunit C